MSLSFILYNIFIMPLVLIMEFVFSVMYRVFGNAGLAIAGVSIAVNVLSLPLYRRADAIQDEERRMQKLLSEPVKHINKTFKGDERFMILQQYYKEQNYSPLFVFRGSLPLLLQIPFFTAAYNYLSNLSILNNTSLWIIKDLGSPDQLLTLFGITINVLPILMTLINFISGMIYTKGFPLKDKAQLYILALVFLIFLYDRPAGLVFYWTLNNLFSLLKNIFLKVIRNPKRVLSFLLGELGVVFATYYIVSGKLVSYTKLVYLFCIFLLLNLPRIVLYVMSGREKTGGDRFLAAAGKIRDRLLSFLDTGEYTGRIFLCSAVSLVVIYGMIIPVSVVSASPGDFVTLYNYINPLFYIISTVLISAGTFLVWGGSVIYFFGNRVVKQVQAFIMFVLAIVSLMNHMIFDRNFGSLSTELDIDGTPKYSIQQITVNIAAILLVIVISGILYKFRNNIIHKIALVVVIGGVVFTAYHSAGVGKSLSQMDIIEQAEMYSNVTEENAEKVVHLSRNGKNVVVILLDRAINGYVPYMFNERPELLKQFSGFTYYPNTLSFGMHTVFGAEAIYGGYEYMPSAINKRADESLEKKINEADLMMPRIFSEHGYQATICDPCYAGFEESPDLSIYDDYPGINAYHTNLGEYTNLLSKDELAAQHNEIRYRNFFWYSIYRSVPLILQNAVYDSGNYFGTTQKNIGQGFMRNYPVLKNLPLLTDISDDSKGSFFMIHNNTTHNPCELQMPDYVPSGNVNNSGLDDPSRFTLNGKTVDAYKEKRGGRYHYHADMSSFIQLGKWFDHLRDEGIYDNTRIILVADHGFDLGQFEDMIVNDELDVEAVNPLLMVKDFNSDGISTDNSFMTNADVPSLAMEGVIENPTNPFTGNSINMQAKNNEKMLVTLSGRHKLEDHKGNVLSTDDAPWYSVRDDIFNKDNWKLEEDPVFEE